MEEEILKKLQDILGESELLPLKRNLENHYATLDSTSKANFLDEIELVYLPNTKYISDKLAGNFIYPVSNEKKEFIEKWVKEKQSQNSSITVNVRKLEKDNQILDSGVEIDLSNTNAKEKIIYLHELGVLDFLRDKQPFISSINKLASVLSAITGEKSGTLQSYLNPMYSKDVSDKNNPLNNKKKVDVIVSQLIKIGFTPK